MGDSRQFSSPAEQYDRFMGRYTKALAPALVEAAQLGDEVARVLDVGCGPGGLARELAQRFGAEHVAAIDPAEQFVVATRERVPGIDARVGVAEQLPWADDTFDAALSSLVLGFMTDPDTGVREMLRVTRPGGVVAICMWDVPNGVTMLREFWQGFRTVRPDAAGDGKLAGTWDGDIEERLGRAGAADIHGGILDVTADYADFDDWWEPLTFKIGPSGAALAQLSDAEQEQVREACRELLPTRGAFTLSARAWFARARAPER